MNAVEKCTLNTPLATCRGIEVSPFDVQIELNIQHQACQLVRNLPTLSGPAIWPDKGQGLEVLEWCEVSAE